MLAGVAAAGALAVAFGVQGVQAAIAEEAAIAKLSTTLGNLGMAESLPEVEAFIDAQQRATGVADDELRPAFDRLIRSTRDVTEAQNLLQTMDKVLKDTPEVDRVFGKAGRAASSLAGPKSRTCSKCASLTARRTAVSSGDAACPSRALETRSRTVMVMHERVFIQIRAQSRASGSDHDK